MEQKRKCIVFFLFIVNISMITVTATSSSSNITIFQVVNNGTQFMINLDYDLESTPVRDETKSVVILLLISLPTDTGLKEIKGAMLFIRTPLGDNLLFWTLNDPFITNTIWNLGQEYTHYQVSYTELFLTFLESPDINNPELIWNVLAKNIVVNTVTDSQNDFQEILGFFLQDVASLYGIPEETEPTTTTTTTTTTTSLTTISETTTGIATGFIILTSLSGVLLIIKRKNRRKN